MSDGLRGGAVLCAAPACAARYCCRNTCLLCACARHSDQLECLRVPGPGGARQCQALIQQQLTHLSCYVDCHVFQLVRFVVSACLLAPLWHMLAASCLCVALAPLASLLSPGGELCVAMKAHESSCTAVLAAATPAAHAWGSFVV